jgi:hypothetical protein
MPNENEINPQEAEEVEPHEAVAAMTPEQRKEFAEWVRDYVHPRDRPTTTDQPKTEQ